MSAQSTDVTITDPVELLALHLALCEARYHPDPERAEIQGSGLLAGLHTRVYDALVAGEQDRPDGWRSLRRWRPGSSIDTRVREIISRPGWSRMSAASREAYVRDLIAPYEADESDIRSLIDFGDALHASDGASAGRSDD